MNTVFLTLIIGSLVTNIVSQNNPQCIDNPTGEVSLNVRGIPGSKGDKGDIGPTGQKGNRGRMGSKGQKGVQGAEGIQGPVGPPGLEGSIGARGHPGHDGARGPPGQLGPPGLEGSIGPRGYPGHTGTQGPPGKPGPPGPRGRQGEPGDTVLNREVINHINTKFDTVIREVNSTLFDVVMELKTSSQTALNAVMTELKLMNKTLNTLKQMNAVTKCGISGNWRRIAHLDTTQGDTCPSNLRTVTNTTTGQTACGRTTGPGCSKLTFIIGNDYCHVCGRVRGYQYYSMDAFDLRVTQSDPQSASTRKSIDGYYVDGVSITQGQPLKHLWTYAVGVSEYVSSYSCPCAVPTGKQPTNPPEFVGNNYYCESGFPGTNYNRVVWEDPLWDGHNCMARNKCCDRYGWFHRQVPPSSDDITVRLCGDEHINDEDVLIDQFEIWVM